LKEFAAAISKSKTPAKTTTSIQSFATHTSKEVCVHQGSL
jgi:hypothetical protein